MIDGVPLGLANGIGVVGLATLVVDGLPWPTITAAGGGWILLGICLYGYITGRWWVSRREADIYLKRAELAESNNNKLAVQNAELMAWAELGKSTFVALRGAQEADK